METPTRKLQIALYWGAACGGCDVAVLDTNEFILDVAALCDILECSPTDLIEVVAAKQSVKKVAGTACSAPPRSRRTTIRRPD